MKRLFMLITDFVRGIRMIDDSSDDNQDLKVF